MNSPISIQETGAGLVALRKLYIRRAETLLDDVNFDHVIRQTRLSWNMQFPEYQLSAPSDLDGEWPARLRRDMHELGLDVNPLAPCPKAVPQERFDRVTNAALVWVLVMLHAISTHFFPPIEFRNHLGRLRGHPAYGFVSAALVANRLHDVKGQAKQYFPPFELRAESAAPSVELLLAFARPERQAAILEDYGLSVPSIPGLVSSDWRTAAPSIIATTDKLLSPFTPWARIAALLRDGMSLAKIARKTGHSIDALKSASKKRNSG